MRTRWRTVAALLLVGLPLVAAQAQVGVPIRLGEPTSGKPTRTNPLSDSPGVQAVVHAPGGRLVSAHGEGGIVRLWDLTTAREMRRFTLASNSWVKAAAVSPDGRMIAAAGWTRTGREYAIVLKCWSVADGKELLSRQFDTEVTTLAFSPDSKDLAFALGMVDLANVTENDFHIFLIDLPTGKQRLRWRGHIWPTEALGFTPDGKGLFSYGEKTVRFWDPSSGAKRSEFPLSGPYPGWKIDARFSIDGRRFVASEFVDQAGSVIIVRQLPTGRELRRFALPAPRQLVVALSPDGRALVTGREDRRGSVKCQLDVWEVATGRKVRTFQRPGCSVVSAAFSFDGRVLTTGMADDTILLWDMTGRSAGARPSEKPEVLWEKLAAEDANQAYDAVWALVADPERAVPLLGDRLRPAGPPDPRQLARLIAELDSEAFQTRQQAVADLEKLGEGVLPSLRLLEGKPTAEARRGMEEVVERLAGPASTPERVRLIRAVAVLEQIGTPEARKVLQRLAEGMPEALLTQEAKAALFRLMR
jgi:WD40 repeat protein